MAKILLIYTHKHYYIHVISWTDWQPLRLNEKHVLYIVDAERVKSHSAIAYTSEGFHEKVYSSVGYGSTGQASPEGHRYGRTHFSPELVRFIILAEINQLNTDRSRNRPVVKQLTDWRRCRRTILPQHVMDLQVCHSSSTHKTQFVVGLVLSGREDWPLYWPPWISISLHLTWFGRGLKFGALSVEMNYIKRRINNLEKWAAE